MTPALLISHRFISNALGILAVAFFCLLPLSAKADEGQQAFVQKLGQEALATLETAEGDETVISDSIRKWLKQYFDKDAIARFALGPHWRTANDKQRKEYTDIFEDMIVLTYSQRLKEYSGETFDVTGENKVNDRDTIVNSVIIPSQRGAPKTRVDWRVRTVKGKMKIVDVMVEGVSMSVTQRADFDAVIQRNGGSFDKFLDALRAKVG